MNKIICPISADRINENIPRLIALIVILQLALFIVTGFWPIITFLAIDFFLRSSNYSRYSPVGRLATYLVKITNNKGAKIDKAPKVFAARLGFVLTLAITVLLAAGNQSAVIILSSGLIAFATLECVFNLCVGCYIYSWIILPFANQNS